MIDKASLSVAIIAILISAGSIAYTSSVIGGVSSQIDSAKKDLSGQITSQVGQVTSKISPLESSVNSVKQEQTAIRSLVDQRIGGLEKSLQEAQQRLAQAEQQAKQSQQELQALQAERALEEAAKKEKAPLVYGVMDAPDFSGIVWPRFRESYPWAPAEPRYIEGFAPLRGRFVSEYNANTPSADLLLQSEAPMIGDLQSYLQPFPDMKYISLHAPAISFPNQKEPIMFSPFLLPAVIVYNTNLLKADEAPKSWLELSNSKWKGKIALQDTRRLETTTTLLSDLQLAFGQAKWDTFMKGLAANNPLLVGSNTEAYTKVVAGEFPIGIALINDIIRQKTGTPVAVAYPKEDVIAIDPGAATMIGISKKAPNPNFAKLLVTWLMSPTGQRAVAETGRPPALLTLDHPNSLGKVVPAGMTLLPRNQDFFKDPKKWEALMKSYFA
ncbi:MAG: extracellular solute-binding protein [Thaumarchaeota archaeon]|nr:extracellular solute-binding protein [Nitrososphaerota archaeon]